MKMSIVVLLTVEENGNRNLQEESDPVNYAGPLMVLWPIRTIILKIMWDFSGGPVVKTLRFHCRGHRFDPWLEN